MGEGLCRCVGGARLTDVLPPRLALLPCAPSFSLCSSSPRRRPPKPKRPPRCKKPLTPPSAPSSASMPASIASSRRMRPSSRWPRGLRGRKGPVWVPQPLTSVPDSAARTSGYLLFSDIPNNTIYRWSEGSGLEVFLRPAGYQWSDPAGKELGTNGLALDRDGRLVMCDHGNRALVRLDAQNFTKTRLATSYGGRRFNSPNDLAVHTSGAIYFTDPPYGLEGLNASPVKELERQRRLPPGSRRRRHARLDRLHLPQRPRLLARRGHALRRPVGRRAPHPPRLRRRGGRLP